MGEALAQRVPNVHMAGIQLCEEGPLVVLLPSLLGAEHPLPFSRIKCLQSMPQYKGTRKEHGAHVCTALLQGTSSQTRSAGVSSGCVPANPALEQAQEDAPSAQLLPGSQMQQRLEMAPTPRGSFDVPQGAAVGTFHTLCSCWG